MNTKTTWRCPTCTFLNHNPIAQNCNICLASRTEGTVEQPILISDSPPRKRPIEVLDVPIQFIAEQSNNTKKQKRDCYEEGRLEMTNSISIQDLIQHDLQRAFFSAYCIDDDWLMSLLPPNIPICIARPKPSDITVDKLTISKFIQFVFPRMSFGYGVMHIKLMLLWYPNFIRVVIPSANLVEFDWNCIENMVFYQDFKSGDVDCLFKRDLKDVLTRMGADQVVQRLEGFDYSKAKGQLVCSVPGWHHDIDTVGHTRLAKIVREMGLKFKSHTVTAQGSSLGGLTERWCNEFYSSCLGKQGLEKNELEIVFPSRNTVYKAMGILDANGQVYKDISQHVKKQYTGGTIHFKKKYWDQKNYPKRNFHDCKPLSNGLLHSKVLIVCNERDGEVDIHSIKKDGYIYCGSHNTTQSAWGSLTVKGVKKLKILNWELGIVLPFGFGKGLKIPFQYPAPLYTPQDEPWCFDEFAEKYPFLFS